MPVVSGGPLAGQVSVDPSMGDPTIEQMLGGEGGGMMGGPPGQDAPMEGGEQESLSPAARFDRIHTDVRALLTEDDGEFSEQDKLIVSKVETLLSGFKAGREKETEQGLQGKMSPGLMRRAAGGPGY